MLSSVSGKHLPIIYAVLASLCFASSTFLSKMLGGGYLGEALHPLQVTHARFAFGFITALCLFILRDRQKIIQPHLRLHLLRVSLGWMGVAIMFSGVVYSPASDAIALSFMNPIFAMIFAVLLLGETVGRHRWAAAGCAFIGAVILLRPSGWQVNPIALMCLFGAAAFGLEIIIIKILSGRERPLQILVISNAIGSVIATAPLFFVATMPQGVQWGGLAAVGGVMVLGQMLFLLAMQRADASLVAPYIYATLLFVVGLDFLVLDVRPDRLSLAGAAIIIGACLYIAYREHRRKSGPAPSQSGATGPCQTDHEG